MRLAQLLDMSVVQRLVEANFTTNGMPIGIVDGDGSVLVGCGWQDICARFHRVHPQSLERCRKSDSSIQARISQSPSEEGAHEYKCENGLRDIGIPIVVAGEHLATLFLGQFFYEGESPDREFFVGQARQFGYDEQAYLAALDRVPVFSPRSIARIIEYDKALARFIADLAEGSLRHLKDQQTIKDSEERYRSLFESSADAILASDLEGRLTEANPAALRMLGYTRQELLKLTYHQLTPARWRAMTEAILREQVLERGYSDEFEKEYVRKDGVLIAVSVRAFARRGFASNPAGVWAIARDITDRKQSERALRASEQRLAEIVQRAPAFMCVLRGPEHVFELVNEKYLQLVGRRDIIGKRLLQALPEVAGTVYPQILDRVLQTGEPFADSNAHVMLNRGPDGSPEDTFLDLVYLPLHEPDGAVSGIFAYGVDITERKRAEEALRYERDFNKSVTENAGESIFVTDEEGRVTFLNREAERVFGFTSQELTGRILHDAIHHHHPDGRPYSSSECTSRGISSGSEAMRRYEDVFFRKDGSAVNVSCSGAQLELAGKRIGSVFIARDVTELTRAEQALRHSEKRFRALIEKSTDVIFILSADGRITFWSPSATEVLGWTAEEAVGRSWYDFVHPDDHPILANAMATVLPRPRASARITMRSRHKNGSWHLVESEGRNLLADPAVLGIVVNGRDVTEQRRMEEQFYQAQKMESVGRLAGGVAHDFNNLVTVILAGVEALKHDLRQGLAPEPEIVEEVGAAGERARDLTRQLLAFARRQVIDPVPLDLNVLMRSSEKLLRRVLGEDVELSTKLQPALWPVRCDPGQVEQVVLNLAVNARDAMPRGGKLSIETTNVDVDEALTASRPWMRKGSYARLSIRDSGQGMSPEVLAHVFEPFFTTKPVGKGTGLGLATVYGIVKQSEGYILVESTPGEGTTFDLFFPRILDFPVAAVPPAPVRPTQGTETVLVVEDDPQVREVVIRSLRAGGYRVLAAGGAQEALELGANGHGPLHLLLTDIVMPGLDGRAVADRLRPRHPGLRVLYVSGYTRDAIVQRAVLDAGIDFLPKPFTQSTLLARVREVLDSP